MDLTHLEFDEQVAHWGRSVMFQMDNLALSELISLGCFHVVELLSKIANV